MNVVVVSGVWPPDVGGPASHAPEFCDYLLERGHAVTAVTIADRAPAPTRYPVRWVRRGLPLGARHVGVAALVARLAPSADVVYSTGMIGRSAVGAAMSGLPIVVKLTSDPAFERALRWRLAGPDLERFQRTHGLRIGLLRRGRDFALDRAKRVVVPSDALRQLAVGWGVAAEKIELLPNPVAPPPELGQRRELRERHGLRGPTLVFAGRLVPQKSIDVALEAIRGNASVSLLLAGDGPQRERLERRTRKLNLNGRVCFLGPRTRKAVFELLRAADAALLSSSWENFPHVIVEALAVGTPVISTATGGVAEIVRDGENGLLVPTGDVDGLADAIRRFFADEALRTRLREAAPGSVTEYAPDRIYGRLEEILVAAAGL